MKFEGRTLQILKNFASINPSLQFKQGSYITTISPVKTLMAKAAIKEHIPHTFAIYDLSRFLGVLSLFDSPTLNMEERLLTVSGSGRKVQYTYADPKLIVTPGDKEIKLPSVDIEFDLKSDTLQSVLKAMGVLGLPEIAVTGEDGTLSLQAIDSKNPSSDKFSIDIGTTSLTFRMIFLAENIKILNEDYKVAISSKGLAHFIGSDIEYWIATESSSTFKGD